MVEIFQDIVAKPRRNDNTTFDSEFEQPCAGAGGEGEAAEKSRQISHCFQGLIYIKLSSSGKDRQGMAPKAKGLKS